MVKYAFDIEKNNG